ncbi:MAG: transketolase family protein [Actinomycetota bacterium]
MTTSERSFESWEVRRQATQLVAVGRALADLADRDPRIVVGSADLKYATLVSEFEERHPDRFFQFGIAERNMFGAAAGMATSGLLPYVSTFASFSGLLGYEAIRTDLAYPQVPVRILATHAGISMGFFSTSHHATEDLAALRAIAGLTVLSPADGRSAAALIAETVDLPGPIYVRLGRGREPDAYDELPAGFGFGRPQLVREGDDLLIVATGIMVGNALRAANELADRGIAAGVLDVHTVKPFPTAAIAEALGRARAVLVVEEHNVEGGLGTMVAETAAAAGLRVPLLKHGIPDEYCIIGPPAHCYAYYALDVAGIATVAGRFAERAGSWFAGADRTCWTDADRARAIEESRATDRLPPDLSATPSA